MNDHYLYGTWESIKQRCYNKNHQNYNRYGGRGIKLYDDWHKFGAFVEYIIANLGDRPEGSTLDRIDNSKGYEPDNIRWATRKQQSANRDLSVNNKHGYQGLSYDKFRDKWLVRMQLGDKYQYIGRYDTQEEALSAILHIESIRHL